MLRVRQEKCRGSEAKELTQAAVGDKLPSRIMATVSRALVLSHSHAFWWI